MKGTEDTVSRERRLQGNTGRLCIPYFADD